ncbi:hypothetical protein [Bifidobacterium apri]|uniref:Uncharacterized protein n=1 Tax=Bifidobacterium apri TaxID=1769423 RepID=A0A6A2VHF5_9BIFI|nr:hypothetical protein [Bifidobacterium apri]KAB8298391.1 hypothetical protein DSM100238_1078 [Bifidobacterium apri]
MANDKNNKDVKDVKKAFGDIDLVLINIVVLLILLTIMLPSGEWTPMAVICVLMMLNVTEMVAKMTKKVAKRAEREGKIPQQGAGAKAAASE